MWHRTRWVYPCGHYMLTEPTPCSYDLGYGAGSCHTEHLTVRAVLPEPPLDSAGRCSDCEFCMGRAPCLLHRAKLELERMAQGAVRDVVHESATNQSDAICDHRVEQWRKNIPPLEMWQAAETAILEGFLQVASTSQNKPPAQEDPGPRTDARRFQDCIIRSDSWPGGVLRFRMEIQWAQIVMKQEKTTQLPA